MTPKRLDWRSLERKLATMRRLLGQLESLGLVNLARLEAEPLTALAVERILILLVDLAYTVNGHVGAAVVGEAPETYAASFALAAKAGLIDEELAARLAPSAGMRSILVHAYLEVDQRIVAAAIPRALADYAEYVRQAARWLAGRES